MDAAEPLDLITIGQASLDTVTNDRGVMASLLGGAALYVAVIAASLGLRTGLVAHAGDVDELAARLLALLSEAAVDPAGVHQEAGPSTRIDLVYDGDWLRQIAVFEGVGAFLSPDSVPDAYAGARMVHIGPAPYEAQVQLARQMQQRGALVSFDPHAEFNQRPFEHLARIVRHVDIFFSNATEALAITGARDLGDAMTLIQRAGPATVVTTRGQEGTIIMQDEEVVSVPALKPLMPAVDCTGAGDAFAAGFLVGIRRDLPVRACGLLGAAAAASVIQDFGMRCRPTSRAVHETLIANALHREPVRVA